MGLYDAHKLHILSNSANSFAGRPYFQHIISRLYRPLRTSSSYRLKAATCLIFGDWKYASNYGKVAYRQCAAGSFHGDGSR